MRMRPHHGICIGFFEGKGYSDEFVKNMTGIIQYLEEHQDDLFYLESKMDRICFACPNNVEQICTTAEKVARYDRLCLELCGLKDGSHLSWREYRNLVVEKILKANKLQAVCGDCGWYSICEKAAQKYRKGSETNGL